jgi:hypothetical protein
VCGVRRQIRLLLLRCPDTREPKPPESRSYPPCASSWQRQTRRSRRVIEKSRCWSPSRCRRASRQCGFCSRSTPPVFASRRPLNSCRSCRSCRRRKSSSGPGERWAGKRLFIIATRGPVGNLYHSHCLSNACLFVPPTVDGWPEESSCSVFGSSLVVGGISPARPQFPNSGPIKMPRSTLLIDGETGTGVGTSSGQFLPLFPSSAKRRVAGAGRRGRLSSIPLQTLETNRWSLRHPMGGQPKVVHSVLKRHLRIGFTLPLPFAQHSRKHCWGVAHCIHPSSLAQVTSWEPPTLGVAPTCPLRPCPSFPRRLDAGQSRARK